MYITANSPCMKQKKLKPIEKHNVLMAFGTQSEFFSGSSYRLYRLGTVHVTWPLNLFL